MPQRLRNLDGLEMRPDAVLQRPQLGVRIGLITAFWTEVETSLAFLLAVIIDTEAQTAAELYAAVVNHSTRTEMLKAAARTRLDQNLFTEVENVIKDARHRAGERNAIVHGMWGISPLHTDALILAKANDAILKTVAVWASGASLGRRPPEITYQVWKKKDFTNVEDRIRVLGASIDTLTAKIGQSGQPSAAP